MSENVVRRPLSTMEAATIAKIAWNATAKYCESLGTPMTLWESLNPGQRPVFTSITLRQVAVLAGLAEEQGPTDPEYFGIFAYGGCDPLTDPQSQVWYTAFVFLARQLVDLHTMEKMPKFLRKYEYKV